MQRRFPSRSEYLTLALNPDLALDPALPLVGGICYPSLYMMAVHRAYPVRTPYGQKAYRKPASHVSGCFWSPYRHADANHEQVTDRYHRGRSISLGPALR